jgi:hypothetical protein
MLAKTEIAIATLLVLASTSTVLAASANRSHYRGPVVRSRTAPTPFELSNGTAAHAVKPFTAEEKAWFDRASRVF